MTMNNKADCEAHEVEHAGELVTPTWVEIGSHQIDGKKTIGVFAKLLSYAYVSDLKNKSTRC